MRLSTLKIDFLKPYISHICICLALTVPSELLASDFDVFRNLFESEQYSEAYRVLANRKETDIDKNTRALREFGLGVTAYELSKYDDAVDHFQNALGAKSKLDDYVHYYLGLNYYKLGKTNKAKDHLGRVVRRKPLSSRRYQARLVLGEIALEKKQWTLARNHFRYLERRLRNTEEYPQILLNLVKTEFNRRRKWVGCRWARKLYRNHPAHPITASWGIDLQNVKLDGKKIGCVASLRDQKKRIRNLQHNGQSRRARDEIEVLAKRSPKSHKFYTDKILGEYLVNEGLVQEALKILLPYYEAKQKDSEYMKLFAKASARAEEYQTAVGAYYKAHTLNPRGRGGRNALFQGSFLSYQFKDYDGAIRKFLEFQKKYRRSGLARDAKWYLSWIHYLRKDYDGSRSGLKHMMRSRRWRRRNPKTTRKATYWLAMGHLKDGNLVEAKRVFKKLSTDNLFNYYSLASQARLESLKDVDVKRELAKIPVPADPDVVIEAIEDEPSEEQESETVLAKEEEEGEEVEEDVASSDPVGQLVEAPDEEEKTIVTTFKDPRLAARFDRATDLELLGLNDLAKWELYAIEKRTRNREYLKALTTHYERIGAYHRSSYIGEIHFVGDRKRQELSTVKPLWLSTYPIAFKRSVETFSKSFGVPKELVWAIMRTESHYKKNARSPVGALGLMQIMPYTGQRLAKLLSINGFESSGLLEPDMNIRLGTRYLSRLSRKFDGNIGMIAAGYNAGPHRVDRWLKSFGHLDMDEFIEHIPYLQTREYVKKVTRNFYVYKRLYGDEKEVKFSWLSQPIGLKVAEVNTAREDWSDIE